MVNYVAAVSTWIPGGKRVKGIRLNGDELQGPVLGNAQACGPPQGLRGSLDSQWQGEIRVLSNEGLADSRRAKLMTAARDGEPFDVQTGLPASELRALKQRTTWYVLAREYIEQRWDRMPGTTRRTLADAHATITPAFVEPELVAQAPRELRRALYSWAFNKNAWKADPPEEWQAALDWLQRHSLAVSELQEPDVLRRGLDALCRKVDGTAAAAKTVKRKKAAVNEVFGIAVERGYFKVTR
ncbi:hypothetical protein NKH18_50635 [Streptomyces sp. M10(2022)]